MFILNHLNKYILGQTKSNNDRAYNTINRLVYGIYYDKDLYAFVCNNFLCESFEDKIYVHDRLMLEEQCRICFQLDNNNIESIKNNSEVYHIDRAVDNYSSYIFIDKISAAPDIIRKMVHLCYNNKNIINKYKTTVHSYYNSDWVSIKTVVYQYHFILGIVFDITYTSNKIIIEIFESDNKIKHVYIKQT
jgi:hypothetical protein